MLSLSPTFFPLISSKVLRLSSSIVSKIDARHTQFISHDRIVYRPGLTALLCWHWPYIHGSLLFHPIMSLQPSLADQIIDHYEISAFDQPAQVFLPQDCISKLITEDAVIKEFEEEDAGDTRFEFETTKDQKLVAFILKHAKKVFATAVVCDISGNELYKVMGKFKEGNFQDSSLPVKAGVLYELPCFSIKTWSNLKKLNFVSKQFVFLAPVFSRSEFKLELEPEHIFPFTWVSNEAKEGTFSQVFQVTIHDSHQDMLVSLHFHSPLH